MLAIINGAESQAKEETGINSEEIREDIREETDETDETDGSMRSRESVIKIDEEISEKASEEISEDPSFWMSR